MERGSFGWGGGVVEVVVASGVASALGRCLLPPWALGGLVGGLVDGLGAVLCFFRKPNKSLSSFLYLVLLVKNLSSSRGGGEK